MNQSKSSASFAWVDEKCLTIVSYESYSMIISQKVERIEGTKENDSTSRLCGWSHSAYNLRSVNEVASRFPDLTHALDALSDGRDKREKIVQNCVCQGEMKNHLILQ